MKNLELRQTIKLLNGHLHHECIGKKKLNMISLLILTIVTWCGLLLDDTGL